MKRMERVSKPRDRIPKFGLSLGSSCLTQGGQHRHAQSKTPPNWGAGHAHGGPAGIRERGKDIGGILESWESRTVPTWNNRIRMTPVQQRPGAWAELSGADASEKSGALREPAREGNRSERANGCGSRSGLVVAFESRVTSRREPASSEGGRRGEEGAIGRDVGELLPQSNVSPRSRHIASVSESSP